MSTHTNAHMSTQRGLGQSTKYADEHRCSNALLAKVMQADIESRCSNAVLAVNDADRKGAQMTDTDNINIFMVDADGVVPEEAIDEYGYVCISFEEEDEDYPTSEEIAEILQELAESDHE